jgi:hypothetical protein
MSIAIAAKAPFSRLCQIESSQKIKHAKSRRSACRSVDAPPGNNRAVAHFSKHEGVRLIPHKCHIYVLRWRPNIDCYHQEASDLCQVWRQIHRSWMFCPSFRDGPKSELGERRSMSRSLPLKPIRRLSVYENWFVNIIRRHDLGLRTCHRQSRSC